MVQGRPLLLAPRAAARGQRRRPISCPEVILVAYLGNGDQHMTSSLSSRQSLAAEAVRVTEETFHHVAAHLPLLVRKAFGYALRLERGSLTATLPDGGRFLFEGREPGPAAELVVRDLGFASRLFEGGDIGLAEAYIAGEWDTPDLHAFLYLFCVNHSVIATLLPGRPIVKLIQRFRHWLNRNTKSGSKRNIHAHYDLGNAFYGAWLDRTMTYSSAIYADGDNDLSSAQMRKYRLLAEAGGFKAGDHILEIGCGWGGFAEFAAGEIGCRVTGLTISREQYHYAVERVARAGLSDRVEIRLQDYRDEAGTYDGVASIEMFEAVGEQYWPVYFDQLRDRLKPGGKAALQIITIHERFWENYRTEIDFIRRYIFPGGMLPTPSRLGELAESRGLSRTSELIFGHDYARTLADWRTSFRAAWPRLPELGFDERFRRLWEYYFAYCEAGFRSENIDVRQIVYARA
jgi:cyclopropane-fatty-acyl-phospholipid synthase